MTPTPAFGVMERWQPPGDREDKVPDRSAPRFGQLLRHHRLRRGLTQDALARRCGISVATIRDLEQHRTRLPRRRSVAALVDALRLAGPLRTEFETASLSPTEPVDDHAEYPPSAAEPDDPITLAVLGPLTLRHGNREIAVASLRQRQLLGRLALSANVTVGRDELVDLLWDGDVPATAVGLIQTYVARLRRTLRVGECDRLSLSATPGGYRLDATADTLDTLRFRDLVTRARRAEPPEAARCLISAFELWRGEPFADVAGLRLHPLMTALQEARIAAAASLAELATVVDEDLLPALRLQAAHHPLHEPLQARFMLALAARGRRGEALHHYQHLRRRLVETLGIDPSHELAETHVRILRDRAGAGSATVESVRPAQLPLPTGSLVGRLAQTRQLDRILSRVLDDNSTQIVTIEGGAGVGKTALALHWSHRVADKFEDGQLYVDFRGAESASPVATVRGLLPALGVSPQRIPTGDEALLGLYRTLLYRRRMLIVLDNVRDADQVRPLLPGSDGSMVLVTSRAKLTGLVTTHQATPMPVGSLDADEAVEMLTSRLGRSRTGRHVDAVVRLAELCDRLPLALAIASARAAAEPDLPLDELADLLEGDRDDLSAFSTTDPASDLRAVFSWSYDRLSPDAGRLFRMLSLHPPVDVSLAAAAALAGLSTARVHPLLTELAGTHLVTLHTGGRSELPDLLYRYAGERSRAVDSEADRRAALRRMSDYYLHTAHGAARLLDPHRIPIPLPPADADTEVVAERWCDAVEARHWFITEHAALLCVVDHAEAHGLDDHAWRLAWSLTDFLQRQGFWHDWVRTQHTASRAVRRVGDRLDIAHMTRSLGRAYAQLGEVEPARRHLTEAFERYAELGEHLSQARTLRNLAYVLGRHGFCRDALIHAQEALRLYRPDDDPAERANTLNVIGWHHAILGEYDRALPLCESALEMLRRTDDRRGLGVTLDSLGFIHHHLGDPCRATRCYGEAITVYVDIGDRHNEAETRARLAQTYRELGRDEDAEQAWKLANEILDDLGEFAHVEPLVRPV
ncbi:DNA-binding SARP family transcriptional activator [Stackebrandtia endophytica]|uniref:DNA-binding SARP family transcriptional activator n=1 Tax=Stackebrandtia endophytica TaxID=1496996 RepID=A0A543ATP6_9ACTN|nr:BTAD domain-containing putative transcriptional regulator [Stackebrandtia endophytica]TQL75970.1 DNA-binding SARP family transcriptional activator [Stackebrandtia endophytica]